MLKIKQKRFAQFVDDASMSGETYEPVFPANSNITNYVQELLVSLEFIQRKIYLSNKRRDQKIYFLTSYYCSRAAHQAPIIIQPATLFPQTAAAAIYPYMTR